MTPDFAFALAFVLGDALDLALAASFAFAFAWFCLDFNWLKAACSISSAVGAEAWLGSGAGVSSASFSANCLLAVSSATGKSFASE